MSFQHRRVIKYAGSIKDVYSGDVAIALACVLCAGRDGFYSNEWRMVSGKLGVSIDAVKMFDILLNLYLDVVKLNEIARRIGVSKLRTLRLAPKRGVWDYKVFFLRPITREDAVASFI